MESEVEPNVEPEIPLDLLKEVNSVNKEPVEKSADEDSFEVNFVNEASRDNLVDAPDDSPGLTKIKDKAKATNENSQNRLVHYPDSSTQVGRFATCTVKSKSLQTLTE